MRRKRTKRENPIDNIIKETPNDGELGRKVRALGYSGMASAYPNDYMLGRMVRYTSRYFNNGI